MYWGRGLAEVAVMRRAASAPAAALLLALALAGAALAYSPERVEVKRLPYTFIDAGVLADWTVVGVTADGYLVFLREGAVKRIPLLMESRAHLVLYPRDSPSEVMVWTDAGDVVVADSSGAVLYRKVIGFGSLVKACYAAGNVYMLISTPRGSELWLYSMHTSTWYYVGTGDVVLENAERILWGSPVDVRCGEDGAALLYRPLLPPSAESYYTATVLAVNATSGEAVPGVSVLAYMPEYNFTVAVTTGESGLARLYVPWPVRDLYLYYAYGEAWYLEVVRVDSPDDLLKGIVLQVPGSEFAAPPQVSPPSYVVILRGFRVEETVRVGPATSILAYWGSTIALHDRVTESLIILDLGTGSRYRFGLDGSPTAADLSSGWLVLGTDRGTLYIVRVPGTLAATLYVGSVRDVSIGSSVVAVSSGTGVHLISLETLKDVFRFEEPSLPVQSPYVHMHGDALLFSGEDYTVLAQPLNATEPFSFKMLVPHRVRIVVEDPWGRSAPNCTVLVDGEVAGRTGSDGALEAVLGYGSHRIVAIPPEEWDNVTAAELSVNVEGDTTIKLTLGRAVYRVALRLVEPSSPIVREPVRVSISDPEGNVVFSDELSGRAEAVVWLKPGSYSVRVEPLVSPPMYRQLHEEIEVDGDKEVVLTLPLAKYTVRVNVFALDTGKRLPAKVCAGQVCGTDSVMLPKGEHTIEVVPQVFFNGTPLYETVTRKIRVANDTVIDVTAERKSVVLRLKLVDEFTGEPIRAPMEVIVGARKLTATNGTLEVVVPIGTVTVKVVGIGAYSEKAFAVEARTDVNVTLEVPRRRVSVTIVVNDVLGNPATPGTVTVKSLGGKYTRTFRVPDSGVVKLSLPLSSFLVKFESPFFFSKSIAISLAESTSYTITVMPTPMGWLFKYGSFIAAATGIVVVTLVTRWLLRRVEARIQAVSGELAE